MKKILLIGFMVAMLSFPVASWSLTIGDPAIEIGGVDEFLYSADLGNSGDEGEVAWVNLMLGTSYAIADMTKTNIENTIWVATNDNPRIYAMDFGSSYPEYFFIKVGAKPGATSHYLYSNLQSWQYAVVDLDQTGIEIKNIGKFSHIGEFPGTQVPEPVSLILLGLGLIGIAGIKRKIG